MSIHPTIFISYRRASSEDLARYIHDRLKGEGVDVFYDLDDINAGERWRVRLQKELVNRDVLLVILAPETLHESEWVRHEIKTALDLNKDIIPITHRGYRLSSASVPDEIADLSEFQGIPFEQRYADATIEQIKRALNITVNVTVQAATPPPPQPKQGMSDTVKAAIITGFFGVIVAAIAIIPNLLPSPNNPTLTHTSIPASETPTLIATDTAAPSDTPQLTDTTFPTETLPPPITPTEFIDLNATSVALQQATIDTLNFQIQGSATAAIRITATTAFIETTPTATPTESQVATQGYPCPATVISNSATVLNVVRAEPSLAARLRDPVHRGDEIMLYEKRGENTSNTWYRISDTTVFSEWIPAQYVSLSASCPN